MIYLPKMSSVNVFGICVGRGRGFSGVAAGGGPKSDVPVSSVIVRAPRCVEIVSTTVYLSGESSCATVIVPSPQDANARDVDGSKLLASTPSPMGTLATILPSQPATNITLL